VSEDGAEKRFDPTQSRRERAKRDGNAARSQELAGSVAFAGALGGLVAAMPLLSGAAVTAVRASAAHPFTVDGVAPSFVIAAALIPAVCAALAAMGATLVQTGGLHVAPIRLALDKLAPAAGLKRMFGAEAAVGAVRALVAFAAIVAVVTPVAVHAVGAASVATTPAATARIVQEAMLQACFSAAGVGGVFAFADYALVKRRWLHSLKMTFEDLKRDAKEQDGDPHAKSRRKQLHRTLARTGIARTREASFVVVNPTHLAIAIRYAPPAVAIPEILVRAADAVALDVRALAERAGIPVLEDIPLARLLWNAGEAGRPIPPESFVAIAMVIAALVREGALTV